MGLLVWLPLNGNLNNNGLSGGTAVITSSGATINNNGKIGKTYLFDANDDYISIDSDKLRNCFKGGANPFTIAMWIYNTKTTGARGIPFGDYSLSGTIGFNLELNSSGGSYNDDIRFYWNGSPDYRATNTNITPNTWVHLTVVYDGEKVDFYRNGILVNTRTGTLADRNKTAGVFYLGRDGRTGGTAFGGYLNDFRVYDTALSKKQIREIAKGLVCHYKLDAPKGNPNLLSMVNYYAGANIGGATRNGTIVSLTATSEWAGIAPATSIFKTNGNFVFSYKMQKTGGSLQKIGGHKGSGLTINKWYLDGVLQTALYPDTVNVNDDDTIHEVVLYITSVDTSDGFCYIQPNRSLTTSVSVKIWDMKIENGTIQTSWVPNVSDSIYNANQICTDVSGNGYNATKTGTLIFNPNSPRYSGSTKFDGNASYLAIGRPMPRDALTVNVWAYMDNWANYSGRMGSCTEGGGWNFEPMSGGMNFALGVGATSNVYMNNFTSTQSPLSEITSGWHMFTGTFDGIYKKLYIDGVLKGSTNQCQNSTTLTEATPIFYNGGNGVFIGAEAAGSQTTGTAPFFNGSMSDFRIYATALSDADILTLYKDSGIIDKKNGIYAYEFKEE